MIEDFRQIVDSFQSYALKIVRDLKIVQVREPPLT